MRPDLERRGPLRLEKFLDVTGRKYERCSVIGLAGFIRGEPRDHALGRSRASFTTKIHILCDDHGLPLYFHPTAGQTHESTVLDELLVGADACFVDEDGERIGWPFAIGGDKGYRADWIDQYLLELGIEPVIPSKENEDRAAQRVEFDRQAYRRRNIVKRLIGWPKES
jgi:Transposase DDE domain